MKNKTRQKDWIFLIVCLGLGLLAEISFFHGSIGVSYVVFVAAFYLVLFMRFGFNFEHRRIGLLLMVGIWILAGSYLFYDSTVFRLFNIILIPAIVFFQIVLITSPKSLNWSKLSFVKLVTGKLLDIMNYLVHYLSVVTRRLIRRNKKESRGIVRQVIIGVLVALPLLFIVIQLLMSADAAFAEVIQRIFFLRLEFNAIDFAFRLAFVLIAALFFFCVFKVLGKTTKRELDIRNTEDKKKWQAVIAITILTMLNLVYLLFIAVQFNYFFSDGLQAGFTYATYARQGFFELLVVTLINWTILISFMKRTKTDSPNLKLVLKILYSAIIVASGVLLMSAFIRLSLYEEMYGYTIDRLLAHSFMLFLIVVFAYTLVRVWLENLPILHFYLISGFIFYVALNTINLEEIIVENNLERYEETGKIDIYYFNYIGAEGIKGLVTLYEIDPEYPELEQLLRENKEQLEYNTDESWQSYNFKREEAKELLKELEL
ncbi:DUF4153 domain-containing protein [Oceanobacillus sp. CAU 1775]